MPKLKPGSLKHGSDNEGCPRLADSRASGKERGDRQQPRGAGSRFKLLADPLNKCC